MKGFAAHNRKGIQMNEIKTPKKPIAFYYIIALGVLMLLNFLVIPWISGNRIEDVDYGTFITMTENGAVGSVEVQTNQILFTDRSEKNVYRTGIMDDPEMVARLHKSGAKFSSEIIEEASPIVSLLLSWVLPLAVFIIIGQVLSRQLMKKAGGGANSMMFGMGKSNAKVYVKSSQGIKFSDVEGVDEAEESLREIVDYLHDPGKYSEIGASMPKGVLVNTP